METKIKERPILFSGAMVRALLAGTKTQTRRIIKVQPDNEHYRISTLMSTTGDRRNVGRHFWGRYSAIGNSLLSRSEGYFPCPYGQPGERLWVRETSLISPPNFADYIDCIHFDAVDTEGHGCLIQYLATHPDREAATDLGVTKATPSIFMPRWASRILLEITAVRCERLQDISERDAVAEGVILEGKGQYRHYTGHELNWWCKTATESYRNLWFSINGLGSWEANPWVWVVEFKRVEA